MKFILLGILKWLGIILLALLILILLIVLVVMLSPIRYRLQGEKKEELCGTFGVSWLFGAVKVDGGYTPAEQLKLKVKVLWFTLMGGEEKPKKEKKPKKKKAPKKEELKPNIQAAEKKEEPKAEPKKEEAKPKVKQQRMEQKQPKTVRRVKLSEIEEKPPTEDTEIVLLDEDETFFTGEETAEKKGKIPPVVKEIWSIEDKKGIFRALGKLLKRLMKGILPGDIFVKATVGTGDPTTTGYVLALAGMLTAKFGNDIQIKGDFTKATAEDVEVAVKGRIVLGKLVWAVLAFVLTKPVRKAIWKMIKFLKNKDKDGAEQTKGNGETA
ncbi:MAG: hypothetical protein IKK54_04240 [Anaerotignum sp.]|nr:hypothetical protein [Anaerotignum sp.]